MEKKKKNRSLSTFAVLCLMLVMICVVTLCGTYAKYTTTLTGTDSARVALWSWEINDTAIENGDDEFEMSLFDLLKDSDINEDEEDVVAANGTDKIIAPGTSGSFDIKITNNSEVTANYAFAFETTGLADINEFDFYADEDMTTKLTDVAATEIAANGGEDTVTVYWKWNYEGATGKDAADTTLGFEGTKEVTVTATLTLTQVD